MNQQPEALRLADELEWQSHWKEHAAKLRRLHAENEALRKHMRDVAMLLLDNNKASCIQWAKDLMVSESNDVWVVQSDLRKDAERWRFAMDDGEYGLCKLVRRDRDFEWVHVTLAEFDTAMKGQQ